MLAKRLLAATMFVTKALSQHIHSDVLNFASRQLRMPVQTMMLCADSSYLD